MEQASGRQLAPEVFVEKVAVENTRYQMRAIMEQSPILRGLLQEGRVGIAGGIYSVESGEVRFFEQRFNDGTEPRASGGV